MLSYLRILSDAQKPNTGVWNFSNGSVFINKWQSNSASRNEQNCWEESQLQGFEGQTCFAKHFADEFSANGSSPNISDEGDLLGADWSEYVDIT
jgi:hypothetical protein